MHSGDGFITQLYETIKGASGLLEERVLSIKRRLSSNRIADILHISPRYAQAALYSKIKAYNYFDEAWYRLAYQPVIEFSDDLLLDYVKAGIQNGRDPSPYFNTTLYLRQHPVRPEQALIHYLQSGRSISSGAYRNEETLHAAQKGYQARTETRLIRDARVAPNPFAVFLQCGADSTWRDWSPEADQSWDLIIDHYDPTFVSKLPCNVEFQQVGANPGTKFTAIHSILEKFPQVFSPYEYILFLDDDVVFEPGAISRLFTIIHQHGWEMSQASLSPDSSCSFPVLLNSGTQGWRELNGVELMMPVYSARLLGLVSQLIGQSISGWGFDAALAVMSARLGYHAAVVDDVVAHHPRPINADVGKYYRMLHQAQIYPEVEFTHLQKIFGFTIPLFHEISSNPAGAVKQL